MAFHGQRLQLHLAAPSTEQPILVAPPPPSPAFCRFLDNAHPSHDGSTIWGTVKDLPAVDVLLSTIHDEEKVQFSKVRTCQQSTKAGIFTVRHDFQCRMAGAPCNISLRRGNPLSEEPLSGRRSVDAQQPSLSGTAPATLCEFGLSCCTVGTCLGAWWTSPISPCMKGMLR